MTTVWFSICTRNSSLFITHTDLALPQLSQPFTLFRHYRWYMQWFCLCFVCVCMCFSLSDLLHSSLYWLLSSTPTPDQQFLYFWNDLSAPSNEHACIHKDAVIQPFRLNAYEHAQTFTHASNHLIGYFMWPLLSNVSTRTHMHAVAHPFPAKSMLKALRRWDEWSTAAEVILQSRRTHCLTRTCLHYISYEVHIIEKVKNLKKSKNLKPCIKSDNLI